MFVWVWIKIDWLNWLIEFFLFSLLLDSEPVGSGEPSKPSNKHCVFLLVLRIQAQCWLRSVLQKLLWPFRAHDPSACDRDREPWALAWSSTGSPRFTDFPPNLAKTDWLRARAESSGSLPRARRFVSSGDGNVLWHLSPVFTSDASISISISIRIKLAYALVRTAMT